MSASICLSESWETFSLETPGLLFMLTSWSMSVLRIFTLLIGTPDSPELAAMPRTWLNCAYTTALGLTGTYSAPVPFAKSVLYDDALSDIAFDTIRYSFSLTVSEYPSESLLNLVAFIRSTACSSQRCG